MSLLKDITNAKEGNVLTIPFHHKKISKYIFMAKNMYYLIGGAGGTGKSSYVDDLFIHGIHNWYKTKNDKGIKLTIILRSLERNKKHRLAKWLCMKLYRNYGILIDVPTLLGWGIAKNRIDDDLYQKIKLTYDWIEEIQEEVNIIDGVSNPTGIYLQARNYMESIGTLYYAKIDHEKSEISYFKRRVVNHHPVIKKAEKGECPEVTPYQSIYVPDEPNRVVIHINDHLQAMSTESGYTDKQNLDKMSEYNRILRDLYGMSIVAVNQLNRSVSDTTRRVQTELEPQDSDFTGSSSMFHDCDMASILFNPYKYNLSDFRDYQIRRCVDDFGINRFRSNHLLKNTYGPDNQIFAYQFIGENGMFRELPAPDQIKNYYKIANPQYVQKLTNHK